MIITPLINILDFFLTRETACAVKAKSFHLELA